MARTTWVGQAIERVGAKPWTLIAFSDDMDGLRKVPLNMPAEALEPHLGRPLSHVPDPFGCHASYAAHNNARLCEMLDRFGFRYDFRSSHRQYTSGAFNEGLARIMASYEAVREVILPTIRPEKRRDWSPFFPICESCGRINATRVTGYDATRITVTYLCEGEQAGAVADGRAGEEEPAEAPAGRPGVPGCGHGGEVSVLDGHAKVGWKVDWALRWYALGVHYEMYGKDLIESAALSARICGIMAGTGGRGGPVQSFYEMFLDEEGRKISKSVGRGLTVDAWLSYAPKESLLLFIFKDPRKAKKLSWEVMVRSVDEYLQLLQGRYQKAGEGDELDFVQPGLPDECPYAYPVNYSMLLGLVEAVGAAHPEAVADYVRRYKGAIPASDRALSALVEYATAFVRDRVPPRPAARPLDPKAAAAAGRLSDFLVETREPDEIQGRAYELAREAGIEPKDFFRLLYNLLTGRDSGPRFGPFVKLLGQEKVVRILREAGPQGGHV